MTWAVDVHVYGLEAVLRLQKEQLSHYHAGKLVRDLNNGKRSSAINHTPYKHQQSIKGNRINPVFGDNK